MKLKNSYFYILIFALIPAVCFSQIAITNVAEISKIKQGTTFFAMKDPNSPKALAFVALIKKAWNFSKVDCIKYTDVEKNIAPNNSFVTVTANMMNSNSPTAPTETHIYWELWTTNDKFTYDPKKRKHFNQADKVSIATLELFPDFITQNNPSSLYKMDYDATGHLKNWGTGIVYNYVQELNRLLLKAEEQSFKTVIANKEELKKMSSQTLFVPDYVLVKYNKNNDDETNIQKEKELFDGIQFSYKVLPTAELNEKIVSAETPFYYLLLIKTTDDKLVTITNSQTGEIIYMAYNDIVSNLKAIDLKDIQKAITKK
ncbi:hypothetical protein ACSVH2_03020 [Flavobacterium sp. RSB2_4_14]|uniref:hypothetical protein n=1 Tax=Flavobacterium sp. RSB2_4_14 TaxID=3447665 RepID=UPI003F358A4D